MNKKISAIILGGTVLAASVFAFAGCNNGHKHNYEISYQLADCDSEGYTLHTCTDCGYKYADEFVEPYGHAYRVYYHIEDEGSKQTASLALTAGSEGDIHDMFTSLTAEQMQNHENANYKYCPHYMCPICDMPITQAKGQQELLDVYYRQLIESMARSSMVQNPFFNYTYNMPSVVFEDGRYVPKTELTPFDYLQMQQQFAPRAIMGGGGDFTVDMIIPDGITKINNISLENLTANEYIERVNLPENIQSIGDNAFRYTGIKSIVIPDKLQEIGENAFGDCDDLSVVYYKGTENTWKLLQIMNGNDNLNGADIYFYSEKPATGRYWHYVDGEPTKW